MVAPSPVAPLQASLVGLAYVERLVSSGGVDLNENTWQRVSLTALLLAHKMWDDDCLENAGFAEACAVDLCDLNKMEQAFVSAIGYNLSLSAAEYARYYFALRSICQMSSEVFPLRYLDDALEARLAERSSSIAETYIATAEVALARATRVDEFGRYDELDLRRSV